MLTHSKVIAQKDTHTNTHRQTDRQTDTHTHRHDENITSTAYVGGNSIELDSTLKNVLLLTCTHSICWCKWKPKTQEQLFTPYMVTQGQKRNAAIFR